MLSTSNLIAFAGLVISAPLFVACDDGNSRPSFTPPDSSVPGTGLDSAVADSTVPDSTVPDAGAWVPPGDASPSDASPSDAAVSDGSPPTDGSVAGDGGYTCTPPVTCASVKTAFSNQAACCAPKTPCGLEFPEIDDVNAALFPNAKEFIAEWTKDDPNGKCAPEHFFFGSRPGLDKQRVEVEGGKDILVTPTCESFTLLAFVLPGCCLPGSKCGYSTHESRYTLEYLLTGGTAPFTQPICVSADELNQQLRDSGTLESFARVKAGDGGCNYQALSAELPDMGP